MGNTKEYAHYGLDTFTGTGNDDVFSGSLNSQGQVTFQSFDKLDGGAGKDTLVAQGFVDNVVIQPTSGVNGFETIDLVSASAANFVTLDDGSSTALKTVNVSGDYIKTVHGGRLPAVRPPVLTF